MCCPPPFAKGVLICSVFAPSLYYCNNLRNVVVARRFSCSCSYAYSYSDPAGDHRRSSRTMARTGLRMMPTFPSSPLRFRTASFPRYGSKASLSDGPFPWCAAVKLAPSMPARRHSLHRPSPATTTASLNGSASIPTRASARRCSRGLASLPQGSLAPVRVMLSRSISAYYDPIRQSRRHATTSRHCRLYVAPSLCGSAEATHETFPTFATVLSTRAVDPTPVVRRPVPLCWTGDARLPPRNTESPPPLPASASNPRRTLVFRRCIVRFMLRPACLPSPPDWLRQSEVTCASLRLLRTLSSPLLTLLVAKQRWRSG